MISEKHTARPDMVWHIEGRNGLELIFERDVPGNMSEAEIEEILKRLVAQHLSPDEIVDGSLRRNMAGRRPFFDRIGRELHFGENPYYTAIPRGQ